MENKMNMYMAFKNTTRKGQQVFRLDLDKLVPTILTNLENGKTKMAIDVLPKLIHGTSSKGKKYEAIHFYMWAVEPTKENAYAITEHIIENAFGNKSV